MQEARTTFNFIIKLPKPSFRGCFASFLEEACVLLLVFSSSFLGRSSIFYWARLTLTKPTLNELNLLKLLTMNTKLKLLMKMPIFLFFGGKEAILQTITTKFYYNNAKSKSIEYEVMNEQQRSTAVVHRSLFLLLLALSS